MNTLNNLSFSQNLCLDDSEKFLVKYTTPIFLFKHLFNDLNSCSTHHDALNTLDLVQLLITIIDETKFDLDLINNININKIVDISAADSQINDEYDIEFYTKNCLKYYLNRFKCDWHLALNRFTSVSPSVKSKSDQLLFSNSFKTIAKMLQLQFKFNEKNASVDSLVNVNETVSKNCTLNSSFTNSKSNQLILLSSLMNKIESKNDLEDINSLLLIDKWLFSMIYNPSSTLLATIKHLLISYEKDEANAK